MYAVASVKGATFSIAEPLVVATCVYFCLTFPTSKIIAYFEKKMSVGDHRNGNESRVSKRALQKTKQIASEHERKAKR